MPAASEGSVTRWISRLKAGDPSAAQKLWDRYFRRLLGVARLKLRGASRRAANEEDVALSAFASFCRGVERSRFPELLDRNNLWQLLVVVTARKAYHLLRREGQQKRGGRPAPADCPEVLPEELVLEQLVSREPPPELAAQVAEECHRLLERLADPELQAIALGKMEGFTNDELAARLDCARRTVERKLRLIRCIWEKETT
jgi:DNA-directed RNA polymerase specialized sigma24 family protein